MRLVLALIVLISLLSCAAPRWTDRTTPSDLFWQGVGREGRSFHEAEVRASLELVAEIEGREVEGVTRDYLRSKSVMRDWQVAADEMSVMQHWLQDRVSGFVPAGVHIVDRYENGGLHWAYAVGEKPGMSGRIDVLYRQSLAVTRRKALAPGLAQFQKNEPRKAWTILGVEAVGLVGWGALSLLTSDLKNRRDRATRVSSYDYYDKWANRMAWGSLAMASLAIGTYGFSVMDGLFVTPPEHQLLLTANPETAWAKLALSR